MSTDRASRSCVAAPACRLQAVARAFAGAGATALLLASTMSYGSVPRTSVPGAATPATPDATITTRISARLMARSDIPSPAIDVATRNGVVTLSGLLDTPAQVRKSVAVAWTVRGVRDVDATALRARD